MDSYNYIKPNGLIIDHLFRKTNSTMILPTVIKDLITDYGDGYLFNIQGTYVRNENYDKPIFDMNWLTNIPTNGRVLSPENRDVILEECEVYQDLEHPKKKDVINLFENIAFRTLNTNAMIGEWPNEKYVLRYGYIDEDTAFIIIKNKALDINNRFSFWFFDGDDEDKDTLLHGFD